MSFIDDDDREEMRRRNQGQWRDPEHPVSEQQIQNWQMRPQQPPAQKTPEERALKETERMMRPEMEAAGFSNPIAYVAHLGARRSSDPREARMQEMFRREVVPGATAGGRRDGAAGDERGQFVQVQNRVDMHPSPDAARGGTGAILRPPSVSIGGPSGSRLSPLSEVTRKRMIDDVIRLEGGVNPDPLDPGNAGGTVTNFGITQKTLDAYREKNPHLNYPAGAKNLTRDQATRIYDEEYLQRWRLDEIRDPAIRGIMFDSVVNNGPGRAFPFLQKGLQAMGLFSGNIDAKRWRETLEILKQVGPNQLSELYDKVYDQRAGWVVERKERIAEIEKRQEAFEALDKEKKSPLENLINEARQIRSKYQGSTKPTKEDQARLAEIDSVLEPYGKRKKDEDILNTKRFLEGWKNRYRTFVQPIDPLTPY